MKDLLAGYGRFRTKEWPTQKPVLERLAETGQSPKTLVISCIDSRVDPAMIFDTHPGEMLVVRNVANLIPPYEQDTAYHGTSAALEFSVCVLKVKNIIILGHGNCGGVQALLNGAPENARDFVATWMKIAEAARQHAHELSVDQREQGCEQEAIKISLANLMTFPWIAEKISAGQLHLHGTWFDIAAGVLWLLKPDGNFEIVQ